MKVRFVVSSSGGVGKTAIVELLLVTRNAKCVDISSLNAQISKLYPDKCLYPDSEKPIAVGTEEDLAYEAISKIFESKEEEVIVDVGTETLPHLLLLLRDTNFIEDIFAGGGEVVFSAVVSPDSTSVKIIPIIGFIKGKAKLEVWVNAYRHQEGIAENKAEDLRKIPSVDKVYTIQSPSRRIKTILESCIYRERRSIQDTEKCQAMERSAIEGHIATFKKMEIQ